MKTKRLLWGVSNCFPKGSTSNIVTDFIFRGMYVDLIQRWHEVIDPSSLLILSSENFSSNPQVCSAFDFDFDFKFLSLKKKIIIKKERKKLRSICELTNRNPL